MVANFDQENIEITLNLANNEDQEWIYSEEADTWVLSVISTVAYPELPDQQVVSGSIPVAYVSGIDTNGDSELDVTGENYSETVK